MVPLGVHINLPFDKEKELLGLIKKFVRSKNPVRYFALMLILQQKWGFGHDEDQGDYKSNIKYKSKALSLGRPSGLSLHLLLPLILQSDVLLEHDT